MDLFVADPEWGWWILLYFYLGGIAAGAYFVSTLIDLVGSQDDRDLPRVGYLIAFPLVMLCGLFLTVDLERPERFWHMLFRSAVVHQALEEGWPLAGHAWKTMGGAFLLKRWSPMSAGAWALTIFGACSFCTFLGSLWPEGRLARGLRHSLFARVVQGIGCLVGFFVASYTGALLTATNEPLWSDSTWIAPLFLSSAASTGLATMLLFLHRDQPRIDGAVTRLQRADLWALVLELVLFGVFLASLGSLLRPVLGTSHGRLLVIGTLVLGLLIPLALHLRPTLLGRKSAVAASVFALVGGFVLRYGLLTAPPELLARAPELRSRYTALDEPRGSGPSLLPGFSPEDGRAPGGGPGADPGNRPADLQPRSKVYDEP
jgi:formate-dependent nitrite reductase membrane component NrfD